MRGKTGGKTGKAPKRRERCGKMEEIGEWEKMGILNRLN
jgi:hypothetical protein